MGFKPFTLRRLFVAMFLAWAAGALPAAAAGPMTDAQLTQDLDTTLDGLVAQDKFSGAVLLAKRGQVLFEHAYGYADHAFDAPNRVDTKFNLGSMGKMFTGVAMLQLAQQGKLSLDDKLIKDLPDYPNKAIAAQVTLRELLNHTAGLGDFFGPEFGSGNMARYDSLESLLPFFVDKPLQSAPGTKWAYSNAGYIVLGLVIQHVSGQSYYDYVQQHIFAPAGMVDTGNWPADADIPNRAVGYTYMGQPSGAPRKSNVFMLQRGGSAGGGYSTVEDLLRFAEALEGGKLLDAQYTRLALSGQVATTRPAVKYGFGMEEQMANGVRIVGHGGGGPGIQGILDIYPDSGYEVAILSNYDDAMTPVDERLRADLTGEPRLQVATMNASDLKVYAGRYVPVIPAGMQMMGSPPPVIIALGQGGLDVDPGMGPHFFFVPLPDGEFAAKDSPGLRIQFLRDADGKVTAFKTPTGFGPVPPVLANRLP
ncbi:MAG TPA: serine hydrolase domain-containing protein [Gammaproteobacteria bacterium]|jgi:CubicO group peptidase (beta-lactamase class C family)